jgi:GNAT superfamily N-acetyltransferase
MKFAQPKLREDVTVDIIQAYSRHLSLVVPLFDQYRQFYNQPSDLPGARHFLADRLERRDSVIFIASTGEGSKQEGIGFTQLYPSFSSTAMKRVWILNDLFVISSARKQGVGKALLERARQHALETRACEIILSTAVDNQPAQGLYEQMDYRRDTEFCQYLLKLDT